MLGFFFCSTFSTFTSFFVNNGSKVQVQRLGKPSINKERSKQKRLVAGEEDDTEKYPSYTQLN